MTVTCVTVYRLPAAVGSTTVEVAALRTACRTIRNAGETSSCFDIAERIVEASVVGQVDIEVRAEVSEELDRVTGEDNAVGIVQRFRGELQILELLQAESGIVGLIEQSGNGRVIADLAEHAQVVSATAVHDGVINHHGASVFLDGSTGDEVDTVGFGDDTIPIEAGEDGGELEIHATGITLCENDFGAGDAVTSVSDIEAEDRFFTCLVESFFSLERGFAVRGGASTGGGILRDHEVADIGGFFAVDHEVRPTPVAMCDEHFGGNGDGRGE